MSGKNRKKPTLVNIKGITAAARMIKPSAKKVLKGTVKAAVAAQPVVKYLPVAGFVAGAAVGVINNTSLLNLQLPSATDIVLPAALGGVIGNETKKAIKTVAEDGLSNPVALAEVGVGVISLIGNLTLNPDPTAVNTIAVVGGSMLATSAAKSCIKKKKRTVSELNDEVKKLKEREGKLKETIQKEVQQFEEVKNEANSGFSDRDPVQQELNMIRNGRLAKEKWLQEMVKKGQVPNINRGI